MESAHLQTWLCGLPCSSEAGGWRLPPGTEVKSEVRRSGGMGLRVILNARVLVFCSSALPLAPVLIMLIILTY